MLTAAVESLTETLPEIKALIATHYAEVSEHKTRGIPLDPNFDLYLAKDAAGEILLIALRDAGKLVGYLVSFVAPGLHYQSCLTCISDIFFVYPDQRGMQGGVLLFTEWLNEGKRRGVDLLSAGFKSKHAKHVRPLLEAMGFFEAEIMFWKFLKSDVVA